MVEFALMTSVFVGTATKENTATDLCVQYRVRMEVGVLDRIAVLVYMDILAAIVKPITVLDHAMLWPVRDYVRPSCPDLSVLNSCVVLLWAGPGGIRVKHAQRHFRVTEDSSWDYIPGSAKMWTNAVLFPVCVMVARAITMRAPSAATAQLALS